MDITDALRVFVLVDKTRSFTEAAERAGMTQPTASRAIMRLEQELGFPVVERSTRHVRLTSSGQALIEPAERAIDAVEQFWSHAAQNRDIPLRLIMPSSVDELSTGAILARARANGIDVDVRRCSPTECDDDDLAAVDAVLAPASAEQAEWSVPLGIAGDRAELCRGDFPIETLRLGRSRPDERTPRVLLHPDDAATPWGADLRLDLLTAGILPGQILVEPTAVALSYALEGTGMLVCSEAEAQRWELPWRRIAHVGRSRSWRTVRGSALVDELLRLCRTDIGRALGAAA